uniref:Large ribosomal subunit protein bL9 n=1 Tax=Gracilinema caldarium TaxID=215591 RepID=A0A7C3IF67_9SPIR
MKVILNKDVNPLGEEGDVKDVAKGYARNYLFPRGLAVPYTERNLKIFEARRVEIEARKAEKRKDAASLKERLEGTEITITMPAGANGKLYGAVTNQTIADELMKQGFQVERKRIEVPGNHIKSVGKFKIHVRLYENTTAEVTVVIQAQVTKTEEKHDSHKGHQRSNRSAHKEEVNTEATASESTSEAQKSAE